MLIIERTSTLSLTGEALVNHRPAPSCHPEGRSGVLVNSDPDLTPRNSRISIPAEVDHPPIGEVLACGERGHQLDLLGQHPIQ